MRTALVTGASRGIGRGIAHHLAGLGYGLTVTARDGDALTALAAELEQAGAPEVVAVAADLANATTVSEMVAGHDSAFGSMDALILSAGVGSAGDVVAYPMARLEKTMAVNFTAPMTIIQHSLPLLRTAAAATPGIGAKIIGLASITGVYSEPGLAVYGASKAALLSLLETVNQEESPHGVTATGIAPGYVATDMSAWVTDRIPAEQMISVDDVVVLVDALLRLSANVALGPVVMGRSGTSGYCA